MSYTNFTGSPSAGCLISPDFDISNLTNLPNCVKPTWTFFAVINGIAAPPTVVINLLVIFVIVKDERLRNSTYNILLVALAVTDFLLGLLVDSTYCWYLVSLLLRRPPPCLFSYHASIAIVCCALTLNTLMVSSVERYLAIQHPQFYLENVTVKKTIIATVLIWLVSPTFMLGGRILMDNSDKLRKVSNVLIAVLNSSVILYCTVKVQITAYRQRRAIQAQAQEVQQEEQEQQQRRFQEFKRAVTMSLLVVASILFYCPYIISGIVQAIKGKDVSAEFQYIVTPIGASFIYLQSLVNPLIMSLRLSYIRQGIKEKLFCRE